MAITLVGLAVLSGCAHGPAFQKIERPPDNAAVVYIYRPFRVMGSGGCWDVTVDGGTVTTLHNGGYYPYVTAAGEIELGTAEAGCLTLPTLGMLFEWLKIDVEAGQAYYVRSILGSIATGPDRVQAPVAQLEVVSPDVGEEEITRTRLLSEVKRAPGTPPSTPRAGGTVESIGFLESGRTRRADISERLGPPSDIFEGGRIWTYRLDFRKETGFLTAERGQYHLIVVFDGTDVVRDHRLVVVRP